MHWDNKCMAIKRPLPAPQGPQPAPWDSNLPPLLPPPRGTAILTFLVKMFLLFFIMSPCKYELVNPIAQLSRFLNFA